MYARERQDGDCLVKWSMVSNGTVDSGETIVPGERAARQLYPPGKDAGGLNQSGHREDGKQSDELKRSFCRKSREDFCRNEGEGA